MPTILMVFTKGNAPDWLYDLGVPKVTERDSKGNFMSYCPYFADSTYKFYFKRMITAVRQHIEQLPLSIRSWIKGIQGCFGEEGDYIGYKGKVDAKYKLSDAQFTDLFEEFSTYYYNEYKNSNPKIYLLSNPSNNGEAHAKWLLKNCPTGWMKFTHLGKEYQSNYELDDASWLLDILNKKQSGEFVRSRSEVSADNLEQGWWSTHIQRNMFALMSSMIYWGMDWTNQLPSSIQNPLFTEAFNFFNRYSGQKDTLKSTNAMCAFRDGLDASDVNRFPENTYGTALITNANRFRNIANQFAAYGAKLSDIDAAMATEAENLTAKGINDVGWRILPGNYERYLHQLDANSTSTGYWNVDAPSDTNAIYGRFARSISKANGKDALYFDVDNAFFNNAPVNGKYPVSIDVTYLDKGTGSFILYYDSQTKTDKVALRVTCTNSGKWKKASITLADAYMGNRALHNSDFYIKSTTVANVIFSVVELAKPLQKISGSILSATSPAPFDSICYTTTTGPHSFIVNGNFLDGSQVAVGPVAGFRFADSSKGLYKDSLLITNYGSSFQKTIYVTFTPPYGGSFANIPVRGGGFNKLNVPVKAVALASSPSLSANIKTITCNNDKNGMIDLILGNGTGPFSYQWSCSAKPFKEITEDIDNLIPADYTVVVTSAAACSTSATFKITEPEVLQASAIADSSIKCKGGTTTISLSATGGTEPYKSTGNYRVSAGYSSYEVTDKNGCASTVSISLVNGTGLPPAKPTSIIGDNADAHGLCGTGNFAYQVSNVIDATSYVWAPPSNTSIGSQLNNGKNLNLNVNSNFTNGLLGVSAANACGVSGVFTKYVTNIPGTPASITGLTSILKLQLGLIYKVQPAIQGIKYHWTFPAGVIILSGQNTSAVTVNWGTTAGKIQVQAQNDCGQSLPVFLNIGFSAFLSQAQQQGEDAIAKNPGVNLQLLPNPATSFALLNNDLNTNYTIRLCDLTGKVLWQKNNCSGVQKIELNWPCKRNVHGSGN